MSDLPWHTAFTDDKVTPVAVRIRWPIMKPVRLILVGITGVAAVAAFWFHRLAAQPVPPASTNAPAAVAPTVSAERLPECPEALGANPVGGPCIPRALISAPPDPGPDNDKTLAGIDANRNGVRDDVERYVLANYADSPEKTAYLMQYAKAVAPFSAAPIRSTAEALERSSELSRANACAARLISPSSRPMNATELRKFDEWLDASRLIEIQHLNTVERTDQFIRNERLLGGHALTLPEWSSVQSACDFAALNPRTSPKE